MARRALSESDRDAWALYVRHVAALPGRAAPALPVPAAVVVPAPPGVLAIVPAPARPAAPSYVEVGHQPAGVDNGTWGKLRTGKLRATRTLDLHGRTAQNAFLALQAFLHHAHADRVRVVEVITGRGSGETGGVIRRELPLWLNLPPLRPLVLAVAHPHAANVGAVRLLLRKPK
jgi:DNA-nicking Smr family endonuclease